MAVLEVEHAEFAETAATLAPQIERIFLVGGVADPEISPCGPIGLSGTPARGPARGRRKGAGGALR